MWISWLEGVTDNNPWRAASPRSRPLLPHTLRTLRDRSNKGAKVTIKRGSQKQGSWHWVSSSLTREREIKKFRWMKSIWRFLRTWITAKSENSRKFIFNGPHEWRWKPPKWSRSDTIVYSGLDVGRLLLDFSRTSSYEPQKNAKNSKKHEQQNILRYGIRVLKNVFGTGQLVHKSERKEKS